MTNETVSAKLDATLDPLNAIYDQVRAALTLAFQNNLPAPFIATIKRALTRLNDAHDELLEIATTLDPTLCQHQP